MLWQSKKATDLRRDPRILVHSVVTSRDGGEGEFKIRGTARSERDLAVQATRTTPQAATAGRYAHHLGMTEVVSRMPSTGHGSSCRTTSLATIIAH
jgi:hypothetical protein